MVLGHDILYTWNLLFFFDGLLEELQALLLILLQLIDELRPLLLGIKVGIIEIVGFILALETVLDLTSL